MLRVCETFFENRVLRMQRPVVPLAVYGSSANIPLSVRVLVDTRLLDDDAVTFGPSIIPRLSLASVNKEVNDVSAATAKPGFE